MDLVMLRTRSADLHLQEGLYPSREDPWQKAEVRVLIFLESMSSLF